MNIEDRVLVPTNEEIKRFKQFNIIKSNGTIDYIKYKKWFYEFVSNEENSFEKIMERIKRANDITRYMCQEAKVEEKLIPSNGLMTKQQLVRFILKRVDHKEANKILATVVDDTLEAAKKSNKNTIPLDKNKRDEVKDKLILATKPFIDDANKRCNVELKKKRTDIIYQSLKKNGFTEDEINKITNPKKEDIKYQNKKEDKDVPYNPLTDWLYIYYMWMLGRPVVNWYFMGDTYNEYLHEANTNLKDIYYFDFDSYDMGYGPLVQEFDDKYNVDVNPDYIRARLCAINYKSDYKRFYKDYFDYLSNGNPNKELMADDYERLIKTISYYETDKDFPSYGGFKKDKLLENDTSKKGNDLDSNRINIFLDDEIEDEVIPKLNRVTNGGRNAYEIVSKFEMEFEMRR